MNILKKVLISLCIFLWFFSLNNTANAELLNWFNELARGQTGKNITDYRNVEKDFSVWVRENWKVLIKNIIRLFNAVLFILLLYTGFQFINSMWTDDDSLSKWKRSIWYIIIWFVFINFPYQLYDTITNDKLTEFRFWGLTENSSLVNLINTIAVSLQILIWWIAILILVLEWIKLIIGSRKSDEAFKKTKEKIKWVFIALIFIWFIEIWKQFLLSGDFWNTKGGLLSIFSSIANFALFLAAPVAIFFLTLAGYYYIFSGWNEDRTKKWKNIIINTSIWIILVACIYILLNDISLLNF